MSAERAHIISELQKDILLLQGFKPAGNEALHAGLGPMANAFPGSVFPVGAVHEFIATAINDVAATSGFLAGLLATLFGGTGAVLWISASRTIFPPALKMFGIDPDRFIFIDLQKEQEVLWAMDEALKCGALTAVVGEIQEIDFTASRRLQLAVEQSKVTGFIVRHRPRQLNTTACVSRWRITSLPSMHTEDLPGIGFPQWSVELLRIRNGKPGRWNIRWENEKFQFTSVSHTREELQPRKTG